MVAVIAEQAVSLVVHQVVPPPLAQMADVARTLVEQPVIQQVLTEDAALNMGRS